MMSLNVIFLMAFISLSVKMLEFETIYLKQKYKC